MTEASPPQGSPTDCPDGAVCWHQCAEGDCWRVKNAEPLSGVYEGNRWPAHVIANHPFEEIDYQAAGLSPRDEQVSYCVCCGQHFEEHPDDTPEQAAQWFADLRAEILRGRQP